MKAHITHYTEAEGGDWLPWPYVENVKPSNLQLLTFKTPARYMVWTDRASDAGLLFHALKLSDGAEWDSINGYRKPEWNKAH